MPTTNHNADTKALITLAARVPPEHRDALDERALRAGCSRSEYVATLIREHVDGNSSDDLIVNALQDQREETLRLQAEIGRLRSDLATVLELILLNIGGIAEEDVKRTVSDLLRQSRRPHSEA